MMECVKDTYPDRVVCVVVRTWGKIQWANGGGVIRTIALIVVVYSAPIALEISFIDRYPTKTGKQLEARKRMISHRRQLTNLRYGSVNLTQIPEAERQSEGNG